MPGKGGIRASVILTNLEGFDCGSVVQPRLTADSDFLLMLSFGGTYEVKSGVESSALHRILLSREWSQHRDSALVWYGGSTSQFLTHYPGSMVVVDREGRTVAENASPGEGQPKWVGVAGTSFTRSFHHLSAKDGRLSSDKRTPEAFLEMRRKTELEAAVGFRFADKELAVDGQVSAKICEPEKSQF